MNFIANNIDTIINWLVITLFIFIYIAVNAIGIIKSQIINAFYKYEDGKELHKQNISKFSTGMLGLLHLLLPLPTKKTNRAFYDYNSIKSKCKLLNRMLKASALILLSYGILLYLTLTFTQTIKH